MSFDHLRDQIEKSLIGGSRDRWRPPDQKRGRRPAGTEAAHLEDTGDNNSNASSFRRKQPNLQAQRASEVRRLHRQRYAARIWPLSDRVSAPFPPSVEIRRADCPVHGRALDGASEK
jgi:hypothetical protein